MNILENRDSQGAASQSFEALQAAARRHHAGEGAALIAKSVSGGFVGAYLEEGFPLYFVNEQFLSCLGYERYETFCEAVGGKLLNLIFEEDRESFLSCFEHGLETEDRSLQYRVRHRNHSLLWLEGHGRQILSMDGRPAMISFCMNITQFVKIQREQEEKADRLAEKNRILAELAANIPTGVCEAALDDLYSILYANKSFYNFYGYTPQQMKNELNDQLIKTILPEDLPLVRRTLDAALAEGKRGFEVEHRMIRRDGRVFWILVRGNFSHRKDKNTIHCVTVDITQRKDMEEQLRVNEERFRIALAQTDNTIFDFDLKTKTMMHGDRSAETYGLEKWTYNVPESLVESGVIHPDSVEAFLEMYHKIQIDASAASCVVRTRLITGDYAWRKISMTNVFDGEGHAVRAVGILEDIDDQKRREEVLRDRSERDTLTGLYNKGTTETRIKDYLEEPVHAASNALFIIDIDAFKEVNDHHGHLVGDHVLQESAQRISALFHANDIIGRIGGDEFVVFLKNMRYAQVIQKRAQEVCEAFAGVFECNYSHVHVSCSVGIAVSPRDGNTFEELYQRADIALYDAKRHGKNQFQCYSPEREADSAWETFGRTVIDLLETGN